MEHWADTRTSAHADLHSALEVVDNVLSFLKSTAGKPSKKERALFAAAIVFTYGVWENYVEQLAIELTKQLASKLDPSRVPERVRKSLEKSSAWELSVAPGWRQLWINKVEVQAVGDDGERFGLNTAKSGQVQALLEMVGVAEAIQRIPADNVPEHLLEVAADVAEALNRLVELRGQIVHTGQVPNDLRKSHVDEWRQFVEAVANALDSECRKQCKELLAT